MSRSATAAALLLALAAPAVSRASTWEIDSAHSNVGFSVRHLMVSNVRGSFTGVTGLVQLDEKDLTRSRVEASIDSASIDTGDTKRDEHLRNPDFFDVARHPRITFKSREIRKGGTQGFQIVGDLTLHGVTREVVLDAEAPSPEVKDPWGGVRSGLSATTTIDRKDFGITWNKALDSGGLAVGDAVKVTLEVELVKEVQSAQK